jgi:hypothetical protein
LFFLACAYVVSMYPSPPHQIATILVIFSRTGSKYSGQASPAGDLLHQCPPSPAADGAVAPANVWWVQPTSSGLQGDERNVPRNGYFLSVSLEQRLTASKVRGFANQQPSCTSRTYTLELIS